MHIYAYETGCPQRGQHTVTIEGRGFKSIDQLAFDDGTVRAFKDFLPAGTGTTVSGGADADVLEAMQDLSTVTGGEGDDLLIGGVGDTTYVFNPGDGTDYLVDFGGADTVDGQARDVAGPQTKVTRIGSDTGEYLCV